MLTAVADTNVYISGFVFGGAPELFLRIAEAGGFHLVISDAISAEIAKVLRRKFLWSEDRIEEAQQELARFTKRVEPRETLYVITADPSDNRILECAVATQADYIVSGDKHLLQVGQHENATVVKVADFLQLLQE